MTKIKTGKKPPRLGFVAVVVTAHSNIDFDVNLHAFKYRLFLHFWGQPWSASGVSHTVSNICTASFSPQKENILKQLLFAVQNDGSSQKRPSLQNKQRRKPSQSRVISSNELEGCLPCIYLTVQQILQWKRLSRLIYGKKPGFLKLIWKYKLMLSEKSCLYEDEYGITYNKELFGLF